MRFGWLGFHVEGHSALRNLLQAGVSIEAVVTLDSTEAKKRSGAGDYAEICRSHGIAHHEIRNINDDDAVALLRRLDLDVLFVIGWSQILRSEALSAVRIGVVGAHAVQTPAQPRERSGQLGDPTG